MKQLGREMGQSVEMGTVHAADYMVNALLFTATMFANCVGSLPNCIRSLKRKGLRAKL